MPFRGQKVNLWRRYSHWSKIIFIANATFSIYILYLPTAGLGRQASCKPPALSHKNAQYIARESSFTRTIILLEYIVWCKLVISQFILCVKCTDD